MARRPNLLTRLAGSVNKPKGVSMPQIQKFQGWMNKNPAYGRRQAAWERKQSLKPTPGFAAPPPKPTIQFSPEQTSYMGAQQAAGNPNYRIDPATGQQFVGQVLGPPPVGGPLRRRRAYTRFPKPLGPTRIPGRPLGGIR